MSSPPFDPHAHWQECKECNGSGRGEYQPPDWDDVTGSWAACGSCDGGGRVVDVDCECPACFPEGVEEVANA